MACPQKENGYTAIANELFEALARIRINGEARQVLDVIFRKTYGFNKKEDAISLTQFSLATGMKKSAVQRGVSKLKRLNIILQKEYPIANIYSLNKDFDTWNPLSKKSTSTPKRVGGVLQKDIFRTPKRGIQKTVTKDTITKDIEIGDKSPTPTQIARRFFSDLEAQEDLLNELCAAGMPENPVRAEIAKFISYWTEPNKSGTKVRWELEKTFEVRRRLGNWFRNIKDFKTKNISSNFVDAYGKATGK